jgi:transcriptional antiterminator
MSYKERKSLAQWHQEFDGIVLEDVKDYNIRINKASYLGRRYFINRAYEQFKKSLNWVSYQLGVSKNTIKKSIRENKLYLQGIEVTETIYQHKNQTHYNPEQETIIKDVLFKNSKDNQLLLTSRQLTKIVNDLGIIVSQWLICDRAKKYNLIPLKKASSK